MRFAAFLPTSLLACLGWSPVHAVGSLRLSADRVEAPGGLAGTALTARVTLHRQGALALEFGARSLQSPATPLLRDVRMACRAVGVRAGNLDCRAGHLALHPEGMPALDADVQFSYDAANARFTASSPAIVALGTQWQADLHWQDARWQLTATGSRARIKAAVDWLRPWWQLPAGLALDAGYSAKLTIAGRHATVESGELHASLAGAALQNAASDIVTEDVALDIDATLLAGAPDYRTEWRVAGQRGQALLGPVLLDLGANPVTLSARSRVADGALHLQLLGLQARDLMRGSGELSVILKPALALQRGHFRAETLQFPSAYRSLLQLALATTSFGNLQTTGSAAGELRWSDGALSALQVELDGLDAEDRSRRLVVSGLRGSVTWTSADATPNASSLSWQRLQMLGLDSGSSALRFQAQGRDLRLLEPARVALFDGALQVQRLDFANLGRDVDLAFDASIEPISMPLLSKAFGWPEMAGVLSGRLPGLALRGGTLSVAGDIVAEVFAGRITASGLQLRNALGTFPRLSGNFTARNLDLEQITRTFPIGTMTGRVDADVSGLELFGWSATAFDARVYSTPGDRSRHRISQKAVDSLTRMGGGSGVAGALQSGFLRFFKDFNYDRIDIGCVLRNEVCRMRGLPRPGGGYYLIKGGGLPQLDVVSSTDRVAWPRVVSQIRAALEAGKVEVR